jgi:hypothetical protein
MVKHSVRCLVKMQKRGSDNCPFCRAPTVLMADRGKLFCFPFLISADEVICMYIANVDWALLNFMKDWFPLESREKLTNNRREATREQAEELGMSDGCVIA